MGFVALLLLPRLLGAASVGGKTYSVDTFAAISNVQVLLWWRPGAFEEETSSPLAGEARTGSDGAFRVADLAEGTYRLVAVRRGYRTCTTNITVAGGQTFELVLLLRPESVTMPRVLVTAPREERARVSRLELKTRDLRDVPGTAGDVVSGLKTLPGFTGGGLGGLSVRGSDQGDTRFFYDKIPIPYAYHFSFLLSVFDPEMVDGAEVYTAAFPPEFGDAPGSVINFSSRKSREAGFHGAWSVNPAWSSLWLHYTKPDVATVMVGGRRSYLDLVVGPFVDGLAEGVDGEVESYELPRFWDLHAQVKLLPWTHHAVTALHVQAKDALELQFADAGTHPSIFHGFTALDAGFNTQAIIWRCEPTGKWRNELVLYRQDPDHTVALGRLARIVYDKETYAGYDVAVLEMSDRSRTRGGAGASYHHTLVDLAMPECYLDDGLSLEDFLETERIDYDAIQQFLDGLLEDVGDEPSEPPSGPAESDGEELVNALATAIATASVVRKFTTWRYFGFLEERITLGPFATTLGVRCDYVEYREYLSFTPRIVLEWSASEPLVVTAAWGLYCRLPSDQQWEAAYGNPALGAERTYHYNLSAHWNAGPSFRVAGEVYFKDMYDRILHRDAGYENIGRGRAWGLEILVKATEARARRLQGWASLGLSQAERRDSEDPDEPWYAYRNHEFLVLSLVGKYRVSRRFSLSFRWRGNTGKPYTDIARVEKDPKTGNYTVVANEGKNEARLPFYSALDLRAEWRFPGIFGLEEGILYLDAVNVYNFVYVDADGETVIETRNVIDRRFDPRTGEMEPVRDLPLLPLLGFEIRW